VSLLWPNIRGTVGGSSSAAGLCVCLYVVELCTHECLQQVVSTPPQPTRSSTISRIVEEPEQQPTPPARRKRNIKLPNKKPKTEGVLADGDITSYDSSPLVNSVTSSSDNSPSAHKVAKQEVTSSDDGSPSVSKTANEKLTSGDSPPAKKATKLASSSDSNLVLNKTTNQESDDEVDSIKQEFTVVYTNKQEVSSDKSIAQKKVTSCNTPKDNDTKQEDIPKVNTEQGVASGDSLIVTSSKQEVNSIDDSAKKLDITKQTVSEYYLEQKKSSIEESSSLMEEVLKHFETSKVTTSDYYSSTDLRYNEETEATAASTTSTVTPVLSKETSALVAKMKARGHARAHSAPLAIEEDEPVVSDNKSKEQATATVDINVTPGHSKTAGSKDVKPAPPIVVHYLGPLVLRKEVESLLIREGVSYLERQDFPTLSPTVYWNLVSVHERICVFKCIMSNTFHIIRFGTSLDLAYHLVYHVKLLFLSPTLSTQTIR